MCPGYMYPGDMCPGVNAALCVTIFLNNTERRAVSLHVMRATGVCRRQLIKEYQVVPSRDQSKLPERTDTNCIGYTGTVEWR